LKDKPVVPFDPNKPTPVAVTLWYRAPEILMGSEEYSMPVDCWALGINFAEMIVDRYLFDASGDFSQLLQIFDLLGAPDEQIWPGFLQLPTSRNYEFKASEGKGLKSLMKIVPDQFENTDNTLDATTTTTTRRETVTTSTSTAEENMEGKGETSAAGFSLLSLLLTYDPNTRLKASAAIQHPYFQGPREAIQISTILEAINVKKKETEKAQQLLLEEEMKQWEGLPGLAIWNTLCPSIGSEGERSESPPSLQATKTRLFWDDK